MACKSFLTVDRNDCVTCMIFGLCRSFLWAHVAHAQLETSLPWGDQDVA